MHYSVYAGLAFATLFGAIGPVVARRLSPAIAAWLLSAGGMVAALSGVAALSALGMTLVGDNPSFASAGHWSISSFRRSDPVGWPIAVVAIALLAIGLCRFTWISVRRVQSISAAHRLSHRMPDTGSDLVVLPDATTDAYAVPGRPGRIFVTQGMLALLSHEECTVMLAHERSHLRHHHHRHRTATIIAAALNPLLATLPEAQGWVTERWADEDAAREGDREVVASALRRAATAAGTAQRPTIALPLTADAVESRVAAMRAAPPRRHPLILAAMVLILSLSVLGTLDGVTDEAALFHVAALGHASPLRHDSPVLSPSANGPTGTSTFPSRRS